MILGAILFWPIAVFIGKRAMVYQGGVPVVPYQRFIHVYPNMNPMRSTFRQFRRYAFGSSLIAGYLFASYFTSYKGIKNSWYTRPDFKSKAAMVDTHYDYDEVAYLQLIEQNYGRNKKKEMLGEDNSSLFKRFFRPRDANFKVESNLYAGREQSTNYYAHKNGQFPTLTHDYSDHVNF